MGRQRVRASARLLLLLFQRRIPAGFRLSPGMPVTADVLVGKRTMMAYFLGRAMPLVHEAMREP